MSKKLMLGYGKQPSLLVTVADGYDPREFTFTVENGLWEGRFMYGNIYVYYTRRWHCRVQILTDNQDRLRGYDYNTVFENFHNENYCAPLPKKSIVDFSDFDDDIPF